MPTTKVPKGLIPLLPKDPKGYKWVYRGTKWVSDKKTAFIYAQYGDSKWDIYRYGDTIASGANGHYFEKVKLSTVEPKINTPPADVLKALPKTKLTLPITVGQVAWDAKGNIYRAVCVDRVMDDGSKTVLWLKSETGNAAEVVHATELDGKDFIGKYCLGDTNPNAMDNLWKELPSWIKFVSQDEDGTWYGYAIKPSSGHTMWITDPMDDYQFMIPKAFFPGQYANWKEALISRP